MSTDEHHDYFLDGEENRHSSADGGNRIDFTGSDNPKGPVADEVSPPSRARGCRRWLVGLAVMCVVILVAIFWVRYLNPCAVEAQATGYVTNLEKRGVIFKTFEGVMATRSGINDTAAVYARDFTFTVANDSLAHLLQDKALAHRPVTVVYERYYGTLPWRGSSKNVVTAIR